MTITELQDTLVFVGLIDRDAIDDPENYDEGSTLAQIDELHKMLDDTALLRQALEALKYHQEQTRPIWSTTEAIEALKAALAEHYCDSNCTWLDHALRCVRAEPVESVATRDCKHGQLARSCNICELEAQIKEDEALLRQALESLRGYRREHNHTQPCDAEIALQERLEETR